MKQRILKKTPRGSPEEECKKVKLREAYTLETIITNLSGKSLPLQVMINIPKGSVALGERNSHQIQDIVMEAGSSHLTRKFKRDFYFPSTGNFGMQPATVAMNGVIVACAVFTRETEEKNAAEVSAQSQPEKFLISLNSASEINESNEKAILNEMVKDETKFKELIGILENKKIYVSKFWSLGYLFRDIKNIFVV